MYYYYYYYYGRPGIIGIEGKFNLVYRSMEGMLYRGLRSLSCIDVGTVEDARWRADVSM